MNILVVDDDDISLKLAENVLKSDSHTVYLAEDGLAAIEKIQQVDIQIVISDWNMPRLDGIDLCRFLRSNASVGYIYVIMVTSRNSHEDLLAGLGAGADDFISKPIEPAELILRVRNAERILALETTAVTLFSLARLAESRDEDTGNHLEHIRAYARALGTALLKDPQIRSQVSPRLPDLLYQTSPLHDIGKVGIPDHILLKPGSLNDEEWAVMKRHTEIGAETLNAALEKYPNAEFLRTARDIAWAHHERWDGSGYPRGLRGEAIPLVARIVALADVYDAMTTKRTYKDAQTHELARNLILQARGAAFDPRVVDAFLECEAEFVAIQRA